ncbi:MAG: serine/threonine-protein kinase, partial [Rhodanobacteraceae bacterium]
MSTSSQALRDIFEEALALDPAARPAFYAARGLDTELRERIERMVEADAEDDVVLDRSVDAVARAIGETDETHKLPPGTRIGPFNLLEVLGEGGSSTVFRAERIVDGVRQVVALKLLRRALYSKEAQRQFRRERLALSQLRHPGIARLIEGGVSDAGLGYIAIDLVDGMPITDHAKMLRLDLRARLKLFMQVCRAVEAAHRALIVHRDLKPSNVLVTADGEVKLLDFGIAKLLDADDETQTRLPAFTPAYAAPEQRTGSQITTATDVY